MSTVGDGSPVALRKNRNFQRLWMSQTVSEVGSQAVILAYPLLVIGMTGSATDGGVVASVAAVSALLFRVPAGAVADRMNRRHLMMICEMIRGLTMTLLAVALLLHIASLPLVAALAAIDGSAGVFFVPAERAALRHIVTQDQLPTAAARNEARAFLGDLLGPTVGGLLFSVARWLPFASNAISYVVSTWAVCGIRRPLQTTGPRTPATLTQEVREGWRFVVHEPFLRASAGLVTVINLCYAGVLFVLVAMLTKTGVESALIGTASAAVGVGGLIGALIAPLVLRSVRGRALLLSTFWSMTLLIAVTALLPHGLITALPLAAAMILVPATNGALYARQVAVTPDHVQARVTSVLIFVSATLSPLAPVTGGLLVDYAGADVAFGLFASLMAVAAVLATVSSGIKMTAKAAPPSKPTP